MSDDVTRPQSTSIDESRIDRLVSVIVEQGEGELRRWRLTHSVIGRVILWQRPILTAAGAVTAAAIALVFLAGSSADRAAEANVPEAVMAWLSQEDPDAIVLVSTLAAFQ